jgi:hypothetical protein
MPETHHEEGQEVTQTTIPVSWCAVVVGLLALAGGLIAVAIADPANIHAIAGGYTAMGTGVIIGFIGFFDMHDHARIMRYQRQIIEELGETQQSIGLAVVTDQVAERRNGG